MTLTSYFSIARFIVRPQPQPMSSSVMPGLRSSLSRLQVDLGDLRLFDSVTSVPVKYAQLYLRVGSWNTPKKSSDRS